MQRQCRAPIRLAVLAAGVLALVYAGCRKSVTAPLRPAPRWAGVTVRVAALPGPARLLLQRHGAAWANATGAKLAVTEPAGDTAGADLLLTAPAELPRWAVAGKLRPLPRPEAVDDL